MLKSDLKTSLSSRLGDSNMIYWTSSNLDLIINEALLTFGAISGYFKQQLLIETTDDLSSNKKQIYNLLDSNDVKTGAESLEVSLTYQDIVDWLNADLLSYNDISSDAEIVSFITDAINTFQSETKLILAKKRFNIQVGQNVEISDDVLDIVKAYYIDSSGKYQALQIADENRVALFDVKYISDNAKPRFYSIANLKLNLVDLFPKPAENGYLELIYVVGKSGEQTLSSDCLIPNSLVPYLKYRVLAQVLDKDGTFNDPFRKAYCEKRWQEGLLVGNNYAAIINSKINGVNKVPTSFNDFDAFRYEWLNDIETSAKKINAIALAGYNLIAVNRMPMEVHSLLFEVVSNAPINELNVDIRSDYIPYIEDYCLHLAGFKDGIASLQKSSNLLENFIKISVSHNRYLQQRRISYLDLLQKSKYQSKQSKISVEEENAA